jgi:hypothetical protein
VHKIKPNQTPVHPDADVSAALLHTVGLIAAHTVHTMQTSQMQRVIRCEMAGRAKVGGCSLFGVVHWYIRVRWYVRVHWKITPRESRTLGGSDGGVNGTV